MTPGQPTDRALDETYRREAMGAFAHEIRTPLTALRMALEVADRGPEGAAVFDAELLGLLTRAMDELERLADDFQQVSRIERGRLPTGRSSASLSDLLAVTSTNLTNALTLDIDSPAEIEGPWDASIVTRGLAGVAQGANRMGDGSGTVRVSVTAVDGRTLIALQSGAFGAGPPLPVTADAGFAFFAGRQLLLALGSQVEVTRVQRGCRVEVRLP
jgi:K+-sensing histidine kinase KdpD